MGILDKVRRFLLSERVDAVPAAPSIAQIGERIARGAALQQQTVSPSVMPGGNPLVSGLRRHAIPQVQGWENCQLGYGTPRDKLTYGQNIISIQLTDNELQAMYYGDDVAAKLIDKRPEEAFRRGYKLLGSDGPLATDLFDRAAELELDARMQEAATLSRLYGSSVLVVGAEQGQPWTPLDVTRVRDVKFLNVVDRRFCAVTQYYTDPLQPNYGQPEVYAVFGLNGQATFVHASRIIRFDGTYVDARKRQELGGWTYSVLQRPYEVMRTFATAFQAAGILTADASQAVFKMKGLFEMIASGEKENLQTRMQLVDMSRSSARAVLLDSDGEDFQRVRTEFTGLPEMLDRMMMRLASSIDMPVTILMGRSPAGQNATGDSDFQHWYDSIESQQKKDFEPKILRFFHILSAGKAKRLKLEWHPLQAPTEKERAEVEKLQAESDQIRIDSGVLYPQEVALARFTDSTNGEIEIDEDARRKSLEAEQELDVATVGQPTPEPDETPPVAYAAPGIQPTAAAQGEELSLAPSPPRVP